MENSKKLLLSKTFWLAVLQAAIGIIIAIQAEMPALGWTASVKSILDIILRFATDKPIRIT